MFTAPCIRVRENMTGRYVHRQIDWPKKSKGFRKGKKSLTDGTMDR